MIERQEPGVDAPVPEDALTRRPRRMLNERQVLDIVPVGVVTLWRMVKAGSFPAPTFVSPNRKFWFEDEVVNWQDGINGRRRGRQNRAPKQLRKPTR